MSFAEEIKKVAKTFVIHRGAKNQKVRGYLQEKWIGERKFLVGMEIQSVEQCRGEQLELVREVKIDITECAFTVRG